MNFKLSLILIIIISITIPISIYIFQESDQENILPESAKRAGKTYLYTVSEDQITSIELLGPQKNINFVKSSDGSWDMIEGNKSYPVNPDRWSGITYLLKGPLIQRTIDSSNARNLSEFGLEPPSFSLNIDFKDTDPIFINFGNLSADKSYQYVALKDQKNIYTLNASYGNAFTNFLVSPPTPDWVYNFEPESIDEILIYKSGLLDMAFGRNIFGESNNAWKLCVLIMDEVTGNPTIEKEPCNGTEDANSKTVNSIMHLLENPLIKDVKAQGIETEIDFSKYGITKESTYIYLRNNTFTEKGTLLIKPITISLGNTENNEVYAVFQDSNDVVSVENDWAEKLKLLIK